MWMKKKTEEEINFNIWSDLTIAQISNFWEYDSQEQITFFRNFLNYTLSESWESIFNLKEKYKYKLDWLKKLELWLKAELATYEKLVVVGDLGGCALTLREESVGCLGRFRDRVVCDAFEPHEPLASGCDTTCAFPM